MCLQTHSSAFLQLSQGRFVTYIEQAAPQDLCVLPEVCIFEQFSRFVLQVVKSEIPLDVTEIDVWTCDGASEFFLRHVSAVHGTLFNP